MAVSKKIFNSFAFLGAFIALSLNLIPVSFASDSAATLTDSQQFITRGEAIHDAVQTFDLKDKDGTFINDCIQHLDECFFVFAAMTRYNQMSLNPLQLYPDVPNAYVYADDINIATMLDLVRGFIATKNSPFYPRAYISRIHALKVVLAAAGLMSWREKFELVRDLGGDEGTLRSETTPFQDVNALNDNTWWYPRYVNFALDMGIIDAGEYWHPDAPITKGEYENMLARALKKSQQYQNDINQEDQPSANSSQQALDYGS